jgi:hypothetical protein
LMFNNEEIFMDYFIEKNILYGKRRCWKVLNVQDGCMSTILKDTIFNNIF